VTDEEEEKEDPNTLFTVNLNPKNVDNDHPFKSRFQVNLLHIEAALDKAEILKNNLEELNSFLDKHFPKEQIKLTL
jgi:inhibitor of KinA sporulation pathway (predicted exonuclease)